MSVCHLAFHALRDDRVAVICTELEDNPGNSITSCAAELAAAVCSDRKINPARLVWIEHNAARGTGEAHLPATWERVTFVVLQDPSGPPRISEPSWRHMSFDDWYDLGLRCPTP